MSIGRERRRFLGLAAVATAAVAAWPLAAHAALYWDANGSPVGNNTSTGAGLGGTGTWGSATNWYDGAAEVPWSSGADAIFNGTAGAVTLASPQSAASLTFKTDGYSLAGSTLTVAPSPANFNVDAGVTATIASTLAGSSTLTKLGPGTLVLSNTANANTATTTEGGWRIEGGGVLRISADGSLGAPLPDTARNTVTDIQFNQSTIQFDASFEVDQNRRTKVNTNSSTQNLGDAVFDMHGNVVTWFGSIQGGFGTIVVTSSSNGGRMTFGTDKKASINPFGSVLPAGTVNLTISNNTVLQTSGTVTPTGGELGSETGAGGAPLAILLQTGGQIRSESGGYQFQRNLILGTGGGSLDVGAWDQTFTGTVSGTGSLTKFGTGTLILDNPPSDPWSGGTFVHSGTLQLGRGGSNGLLPGTLATPSSVVLDTGATLRFNRGSNKSFFDIISGGGGVTVTNSNNAVVRMVSDCTYTGPTTITSGIFMIGQGNAGQPGSIVSDVINAGTLDFNRVENLSYGGAISGSGTVVKEAAGKLTLTGASTYSGPTNVNAGTLAATNAAGSATGTGPVNVASGATLAGTGAIAGAVTLNGGAHLSPGSSAGTLTVGSLNSLSNALLDYEMGTPANSDLTIVSTVGGLTLAGGKVNITALAGFGVGEYRLLDYTGSFTGSPSNLSIGSAPAGFGYFFVDNAATTSIDLVVVPEPGCLFAAAAVVMTFAPGYALRRRRPRC